ncbi:MAG: hypothetical protein ACUVV1_03235 [Fimbriimonadales bacterium]
MAKPIPYNRRYVQNQQSAPAPPASEPAPAPPPPAPPRQPADPVQLVTLEEFLRDLGIAFAEEDMPEIAEAPVPEPPATPVAIEEPASVVLEAAQPEEPAGVVLEAVQPEEPAPLALPDAEDIPYAVAIEDAPEPAPADDVDDLFDPVALVQAYLVEEPIQEAEPPIPARFESRCAGCGEMIRVGEPIVRHPRWGRYVHAHCRDRQQPAALNTITARYAGLCRACRQAIVPGERIVQMPPFGWVHAACAERHAGES